MSHHHRNGPLEAAQNEAKQQIGEWWSDYQAGPDGPQATQARTQPGEQHFPVTDSQAISTMQWSLDHDITNAYHDGVMAAGQIPAQDEALSLSEAQQQSGLVYNPYSTQQLSNYNLPKGFSLSPDDQAFVNAFNQQENGTSQAGNFSDETYSLGGTTHNLSSFDQWYRDKSLLDDISNASDADLTHIFNTTPELIEKGNASNAGHYDVADDLKAVLDGGDGKQGLDKLDGEISAADKILYGANGKGGYAQDWGEDLRSIGTGPFDNPSKGDYENTQDDWSSLHHNRDLNKTTLLNDIERAESLPNDEYGSSNGSDSWYNGRSWKNYYENYNYNGVLDDNDNSAIGPGPNHTNTGEPYLAEINGASSAYPDPRTFLPEEAEETDQISKRFFNYDSFHQTPTGKDQISSEASEAQNGDDYAKYRQDLSRFDHDMTDHAPQGRLGEDKSALHDDLQGISHNHNELSQLNGSGDRIFKNLALVDTDFHSMEDLKTHDVNGHMANPTMKSETVHWEDGSGTSSNYKAPKANSKAVLQDAHDGHGGSPDLNHQAESETINVDGTPQDISTETIGTPFRANENGENVVVANVSDLKTLLTTQKEEFKGLSNLDTDLKDQRYLATHNAQGSEVGASNGAAMLPADDVLGGNNKVGSALTSSADSLEKKFATDQSRLQDLEQTQQVRTGQQNFTQDQHNLTNEWQGYHDSTGQYDEGHIIECFAQGTTLTTQRGEVAVEDLRADDALFVREGRFVKPRRIFSDDIIFGAYSPKTHYPICIQKDAIAPSQPSRDIYVSGGHGIAFTLKRKGKTRNFLIPARLLINDRTIYRMNPEHVRYYHIEMPRHSLLNAAGQWTESYFISHRSPHSFSKKLRVLCGANCAQRGEVLPRYLSGRYVRAIRKMINRRAKAAYFKSVCKTLNCA